MNSDGFLSILKKCGGYITDSHIVYTSGRHGNAYLNKDAIYPHTKEISKICGEIADRYMSKNIEIVAAPALGGIILSQWVAYFLSEKTKKEVLGVYTEKTPDKNQIFTRNYDKLVSGKRVLVVEDITTTGGSVMKVIDSVRQAGGTVVGVCVLANRDPENINSSTMGYPFESIAEISLQSWDEKDCPMCKKGVPVNTTVGKGKEYLKNKNK